MESHPAVLVIDNDVSLLRLFLDTLAADYNVHTANGVLAAADLLQTRHFDVMLVATNLRVLDGVEFIRIVRSCPQFDSLPIVAVASNAESVRRVQDAGVQAILSQPVSVTEVDSLIASLVQHS